MNYIKPNILPGCQTFHSDKGQPRTHAALSDMFPAPTLGDSQPPETLASVDPTSSLTFVITSIHVLLPTWCTHIAT